MLHVLTLVCFVLEVLAGPSPEKTGEPSKSERGQSSLSQILPTVTQMIPTSDDKLSTHPKSCQELKGMDPRSPSGHYTTGEGTGNAGVVYCDTDNFDSQVKNTKALPSTHWQDEKQHTYTWTESMASNVQKIMENQESIKQTLATISTKVSTTNTFVEQVAKIQEKISQALATASEVIHALAEKNRELLRNQESLSKKLNTLSKVADSIIQEVAHVQWSSKEVQERLTLTGDTYQLVKYLAINQNSISETLHAIVISTLSSNNQSSTNAGQKTLKKEANMVKRLVQKTEKMFAPSLSNEEVLLQPIEGYYPSSCKSIKIKQPLSKSGMYMLYDSGGKSKKVFCHFDLCNTPGHWTQVAYLNMSNPTQSCPRGLSLYSKKGVRACGRSGLQANCQSIKFPIISPFQQVCGRIIGYQFGKTDGFSGDNISAPYIDGVSLTYGSPRKHIWSFAAVQFLSMYHWCPCVGGLYSSTSNIIGSDYFCETGYHGNAEAMLYTDNPLWDGKGCTNDEAACCQVKGIPWFHKYLDTPTTDFIELRLCGRQSPAINNTPLTLYEIYMK